MRSERVSLSFAGRCTTEYYYAQRETFRGGCTSPRCNSVAPGMNNRHRPSVQTVHGLGSRRGASPFLLLSHTHALSLSLSLPLSLPFIRYSSFIAPSLVLFLAYTPFNGTARARCASGPHRTLPDWPPTTNDLDLYLLPVIFPSVTPQTFI